MQQAGDGFASSADCRNVAERALTLKPCTLRIVRARATLRIEIDGEADRDQQAKNAKPSFQIRVKPTGIQNRDLLARPPVRMLFQ